MSRPFLCPECREPVDDCICEPPAEYDDEEYAEDADVEELDFEDEDQGSDGLDGIEVEDVDYDGE